MILVTKLTLSHNFLRTHKRKSRRKCVQSVGSIPLCWLSSIIFFSVAVEPVEQNIQYIGLIGAEKQDHMLPFSLFRASSDESKKSKKE